MYIYQENQNTEGGLVSIGQRRQHEPNLKSEGIWEKALQEEGIPDATIWMEMGTYLTCSTNRREVSLVFRGSIKGDMSKSKTGVDKALVIQYR